MPQLVYSEEQLLSEHDYARPHVVGSQLLQGGFDANGSYLPPRSRVRPLALAAWLEALRARGWDALAVDRVLVGAKPYPNQAQLALLLREGIEQPFWERLTITAQLEARGRYLAELQVPDFQKIVCEDIGQMGIGHLNKGILRAHGLDEGGEPEKGIGAHDVMWLAVRDLAFGPRDYPAPATPGILGVPQWAERGAWELPEVYERLILFMMNLLLVELRAGDEFELYQRILRDPGLFALRRRQADEAAELIGRIRKDEVLHVQSLRTCLGELRSVTFHCVDGGTERGTAIVDRLWSSVVHFLGVEQLKAEREQLREALTQQILAYPEGARILQAFEALRA